MIYKKRFGRTEHKSSKMIFGSYALSSADKEDADRALELLKQYGVNHIDTAPMYGKAEKLIGNWMGEYREDFFIATKTRNRGYEAALKNLYRSLEYLQVDEIDLWQMHSLTNPQGWKKAMGPDGALEALIEAREKGLVKYLGVTGHGSKAAKMHKKSLERFDFDSVMLPYNYHQMQQSRYASQFKELLDMCRDRGVAVQTIKSIARRPWKDESRPYNTYFYEPLEEQDAIDKAVHWAMGLEDSFVVTPGDLKLLPKVLEAAHRYEKKPTDEEMDEMVEKYDVELVFSY